MIITDTVNYTVNNYRQLSLFIFRDFLLVSVSIGRHYGAKNGENWPASFEHREEIRTEFQNYAHDARSFMTQGDDDYETT